MRDAWIVSLLSILPRRGLSRLQGWVARSGASRLGVRGFVRAYGLDLTDVDGELGDFATLDALFTRRPRPGARPVDSRRHAVVSPVDGTCVFAGPTSDGAFPVAPGRTVSVAALLGGIDGLPDPDAVVLYLSPRDLHGVHAPYAGQIAVWRTIPGTRWPVFDAAVARVPGLFARNERAVVRLDTDAGPLFVVLVAAFGVGDIERTAADTVERGAELAMFHLGSTVILLAPRGRLRLACAAGESVRIGRALGFVDPGPKD